MVEQTDKTYRVVKIKDGKHGLYTEQIPTPGEGEVLIRVEYSSINPYDEVLYMIRKDEGYVMGSEGTGVIVDIGNGVASEL